MKMTVSLMIVMVLVAASFAVLGQKKVKELHLSKVLPVSAQEVWEVVAEDYGGVAYSHPKIIASDYINGSLKGEEGAERVCYFNDSQTQYLKERMVDFSPSEMSFTNQVFQAGKFPVDPDLTRAVYKVEDAGNGMSRITFDMQYRTKPAFMGGMMKGSFTKLIEDYFIAIEHHIKTGDKVTKDNFKEIKKRYAKRDTAAKNDRVLALSAVDE